MIKSKYPLLLALVTSLTLLLPGCGKKEDSQKQPQPPPAETKPVAAQPVPPTQQNPNNNRRMTAIFTANRAEKALDDKLQSFEDYISSRITEKGFSAISREVATTAASSLLKSSAQTDIDELLSRNASVLRLAQMLGANYIIMASINSFGTEKQTIEVYDVKKVSVITSLRVSYKILDGVQGGTLGGDTIKVSSTKVFTENSRIESTVILDDLLDEAAVKIAESAGRKVIQPIDVSSGLAEFTVACGMQDLAQVPVSVPDVQLTANNTVVIGKDRIPVLALNVMVELDGAGIGSTPAAFKAAPGLHKLRLRRDGFKDFEGTITIYQGQTFNVALQMTDAGYQRWKDNTQFLNSIENNKKLTAAEAEKIRGEAQRLRQSGNMVNVKVDTKQNSGAIYKSIF